MKTWGLLAALAITSPANAQSILGSWQELTILGDSQWENGQCAMAFFLERRWDLQKRPSTATDLSGTYSAVIHGRLYRNGTGRCRAQGQRSASPMFTNIRVWSVEGTSSGSTARMRASDAECSQDNCADPKLGMAPFSSLLTLQGDRLVDKDEAAPTTQQVFHRGTWHQARSGEAMAAYQDLLQLLATGSPSQIRARLSPALTAEQSDGLIAGLPMLRTALAATSGREAIEVRVTEMPVNNPLGLIQAAILIYQANGHDGEKRMETAFLHNHNGVWKLQGLY